MKHSSNALKAVACNIVLTFLSVLFLAGCGGGKSGTTDTTPGSKWVEVSNVNSGTTAASLFGTAWINTDYYASHCVGWECLIDNQRTDDFPGVTVTCQNLTTGASGNATSYYGPGTNWQHEWHASVPIISGTNTIEISAFDPGGKGGSVTVEVTSKPPISVLSTSPLDGAMGVFPNTVVSATFSEAIDQNYSYFTVRGPTGTVPGVRAVNGSTVTFTPTNMLAYSSTYTVTLPTTLLSQSGASLASDYTWTFTTMDPPIFRVISTYPADKETGVTTYIMNISAAFSRDIDYNSISYSSFIVTSPAGAPLGSIWGSLDYKTVIGFSLSDKLSANTTYTATLKAGIRDTSGNALPFDYTWTFTTVN